MVMDVPSSLVITKSLSRTRKAGAVWPPNGRSSASGSARQMARTRAIGERAARQSPVGAPAGRPAAARSCATAS